MSEATSATTANPQFAALVAERRALGLRRHAPAYLQGPSLLRPLAVEAIDASNYLVMELERLGVQYPAATDAQRSVTALAVSCTLFAQAAARAAQGATGEDLDVEATARERIQEPAGADCDFESFLYRDNCAEAVEELADAAILAGFELQRRHHQHLGDGLDPEIARLGRIATALAHATLEIAADVLPNATPPAREAPRVA
jgi:hypothetical protein